MQCEMCGKKGTLLRTKVEGVIMKVCRNCSKYGKALGEVKFSLTDVYGHSENFRVENKIEENIVPNYTEIIKNARRKLRLTQEDFAKKIAERLSVVQKLETGGITPSIKLAKKLENRLKIKLVEEINTGDYKQASNSKKEEKFTLGHFLKKKLKK